jgi:hypothetical protein
MPAVLLYAWRSVYCTNPEKKRFTSPRSAISLVEGSDNVPEANCVLGQMCGQVAIRDDADNVTEPHILREQSSDILYVITNFEEGHLSRLP